MFCCTLLYVHFSIAIILMGKRELIALLNLSSWCLVMVERLFLTVPRGCLQFVIVVFPDHTHLLFLISPIEFCSHFRLLRELHRRFFLKTKKKSYFNCIALQNNIEAELKFLSSFEAFKQKKPARENPHGIFPHKLKWEKNSVGFSSKSNYQFY